jgi:hypothetical protein
VLRKLGFRPTGRIEQRFSVGRSRYVSCALFDRQLVADGDALSGTQSAIAMPARAGIADPIMPRAA